jgi:hypothetical protein
MNILTSLLPGLRELRAPLAAGYVWLTALALALAVGARTGAVDPTSLESDIDDAYHALGVAGRLAVVTFAAYIVGVISTSITTALSRAERARRQPELFAWAASFLRLSLEQDRRRETLRRLLAVATESPPSPGGFRWRVKADHLAAAAERIRDSGTDHIAKAEVIDSNELAWVTAIGDLDLPPEVKSSAGVLATSIMTGETERQSIWNHYSTAVHESYVVITNLTASLISVEIDRIILRLQLEKNAAWTAIDRQRTEAEFRWGLVPPVVALAAVVAWRLHAGFIVYVLMSLPTIFVTARLAEWQVLPEVVSTYYYERPWLVRIAKRVGRTAQQFLEQYLVLLLILYATLAALMVWELSAAHAFSLIVITLFGAIGPPALWLVGNVADGRAIQLLRDAMTIADLKPPVIERLEAELSDIEPKDKIGRVTWTIPVADGRVVLIK